MGWDLSVEDVLGPGSSRGVVVAEEVLAVAGKCRPRSVRSGGRDRGHLWLSHSSCGRPIRFRAVRRLRAGTPFTRRKGCGVTAGSHGAHRGTIRGCGDAGDGAPMPRKPNNQRMLEKFSRLHRLTGGAFSAAAHVLARAKPSSSSFLKSPNAVTKQTLWKLWTGCLTLRNV